MNVEFNEKFDKRWPVTFGTAMRGPSSLYQM